MRSAWQVRAGRHGERQDVALDEGLIIAGWENVPDIGQHETRAALRQELASVYPDKSAYLIGNWTGQLWRFTRQIAVGDLVVMPLKNPPRLAIGEVTGTYQFRAEAPPGFRHVRPVKWLRTDISRSEVKPDLRASMGSLLTVCQLTRHDAPARIEQIARHEPDPGWSHSSASLEPDATRTDLLEAVSDGQEPVRLTARGLLAMWGFSRRTATSLAVIQSELADDGIAVQPSLSTVRLDSVVELVPIAEPDTASEAATGSPAIDSTPDPDEIPVKWRVSAVLAADRTVESVVIGSPLSVAVTRMLATNYSQLAVVDEHGYYQGAVTWESIGRARLSNPDATLADATVQVRVVDYDDDLFAQIDEISRRGYVLVRGEDRRSLVGIVTAHDLARQFGVLARPFSLVEEAELRLRRHVIRSLPADRVEKITHRWSNGVPTFGQYGKLLEDSELFAQLEWPLDHQTFLDLVNRVRKIRNELMHFSQDTLPAGDIEAIEGFVSMLRTVDGDG
ncbi:CBS domain-containing protein [Phytoactinopolyspora limicola]|uniref:CBS domain-containing protein n=1 Tax=Phytoactinopolyspora limicola TaxID=2715536 RepID=UPI00140C700C|nr:CBS domain-containing protein [Phytoactinopolyspora limicola]